MSVTEGKENHTDLILLVDDEPNILLSYSVLLKSNGIKNVHTLQDSREVMSFLDSNSAALVVLDLTMPFIPGEDLLVEIKQDYPQLPVIILTATNDIDKAVECMQLGAEDYLVKPVEKNRFISSIQGMLEKLQLKRQVSNLQKYILADSLEYPEAFEEIVTKSQKMFSIFKYIEAVADSPQPVLITGETGVGKELVARALHKCNRSGEFVAVNVAGLDDTMFSDTLFGHTKGAFTDAGNSREGLIARADNGTIFLDEIGDLSPEAQIKLLRLIQEKEYYRLGEDEPIKTSARIVVATNQDLQQLMDNHNFRKDLYYRLCGHHIHVPTLRERPEDIAPLLDYFIQQSTEALGKEKPPVSPKLAEMFQGYKFPGNIRQLERMVHDAVSRHVSGELKLSSFSTLKPDKPKQPSHPEQSETEPENENSFDTKNWPEKIFGQFPTFKQMEDRLIKEALERTDNNQGEAAALLGISRQALNKRLHRNK